MKIYNFLFLIVLILFFTNCDKAGCTDPEACNFDMYAEEDDNSCRYLEEYFDCEGNCLNDSDDDNVCDEFESFGCLDEEAINYNPDATDNNGICVYSGLGVTDVDNNFYNSAIFGEQEWMIENLKVTHYRNEDSISTGLTGSEWANLSNGAYSIYNNDPHNATIYGNLYNWFSVEDDRNIAPEGWHIPTDEEFMELEIFLGMNELDALGTSWRGTDEGSKLKADTLWIYQYQSSTIKSGFEAIGGGVRFYFSTELYLGLDYYCRFWSLSEGDTTLAWSRELSYNNTMVSRHLQYKQNGFSVRCVKDY